MVIATDKSRTLVLLEWKYTEAYKPGVSLARSQRGTDRVEIYRRLLEDPDCPIVLGDHVRLFYDPFYQLMRQTLLAWQMVRCQELGASDWLHVHVIPEENVTLRTIVTSPGLTGVDMSTAWRSVLKRPDRYIVRAPGDITPEVPPDTPWGAWREWLRLRYGT